MNGACVQGITRVFSSVVSVSTSVVSVSFAVWVISWLVLMVVVYCVIMLFCGGCFCVLVVSCVMLGLFVGRTF